MTPDEIVLMYSGSKRTHYQKCYAELAAWGPAFESYYPAMVKTGERAMLFKLRPRGILPQASRAKGVHGWTRCGEELLIPIAAELPYAYLMEHGLRKCLNPDGTRMYTAGMEPREVAATINRMMQPGYVMLSLDATAFDGSLGPLVLEDQELCLAMFRARHCPTEWLEMSFAGQRRLEVRSGGLKASIFGNRASGTARTAVGNKTLFVGSLRFAIGEDWDEGRCGLLSAGDDTLVCVPEELFQRRGDAWWQRMAQLGIEVKVENVARMTTEVLFCRSRPCRIDGVWTMVKTPESALLNVLNLTRHFNGCNLGGYLGALHCGFRNLWSGVPVLWRLHTLYPALKPVAWTLGSSGTEKYLDLSERSSAPPDEMAREDFALAYGVSPSQQIELEGLIDGSASEVCAWLLARVQSINSARKGAVHAAA